MLRKIVTYTDFNGEQRTEALYFNLSQTELMKLNFETGGVKEMLIEMVAKHDLAGLTGIFDKLIRMSYGQKSQDGRNFIKRPEYTEDFCSTGAYDAVYMECLTNEEKAIEFIEGVMPAEFASAAPAITKEQAEEFITNPYNFEEQDLTSKVEKLPENKN